MSALARFWSRLGVHWCREIDPPRGIQTAKVMAGARLMAERGVTTAVVGSTVRIATSGDFSQLLPKLNLDTRQVDIRVRMADRYRTDLDTFANLRVPGRDGPVPLSSIAEVSVQSGPTQIDRYDRKRYVAVNADLAGYPLGAALAAARELPSMVGKPSSVQFLELGDVELMAQLFSGFTFAMITGILCVICVLVLLFKDFLQPATILSALPLSIGGSLVALLVTGGNMDLPALIGIVMLMGIVTKNSILLVEYTFVGMREHGLPMHAALIDACHKRARPIVMTTVAMIAEQALRKLDRAPGILDHLHRLDPGQLIEKPAATGVHEHGMALHL